MKQIEHVLTYAATTVEAVSAMLLTPGFRERVCDELGALRRESTRDGDRIVVDYALSAARVPSFAKKLIGSEIEIVQTETWTSPGHADVEVTIPGKPGEMAGSADLAQAGDDVVETVRLDIEVRIPLVGGKIEGLVADKLVRSLEVEHRVGQAGWPPPEMRFHKEIRFPAAPDVVFVMLADREFRERVAREAGATSYDVQVERHGDGGVRSTIASRQPVGELPAIVRTFVGDELELHQQEEWSTPESGRMVVTVPGRPGQVKGTISLRAEGAETVQTVESEIVVGVPLVGRKLETLIGRILGHVLKLQAGVGAEWLAGRR